MKLYKHYITSKSCCFGLRNAISCSRKWLFSFSVISKSLPYWHIPPLAFHWLVANYLKMQWETCWHPKPHGVLFSWYKRENILKSLSILYQTWDHIMLILSLIFFFFFPLLFRTVTLLQLSEVSGCFFQWTDLFKSSVLILFFLSLAIVTVSYYL